MIKVDSTLPNYLNGKLYKNWDKVSSLFGEKSVLASRSDKKGNFIQFLMSDNGKSRELYAPDYKITDIIDSNGNKTTYIHQRLSNGEIRGQMIPDRRKANPFIIFAQWVTKDLMPQWVDLRLNPNHPNARMFLGSDTNQIPKSIKVVERIRARNFEGIDFPLTKTIQYKTVEGEIIKLESDYAMNNLNFAKTFGITESDQLGKHLRTVV